MENIITQIRKSIEQDTIEIRLHARKRMAQRNITYDDVCEVILKGTIVEKYPESFPYPSCLFMNFIESKALYAVCSWDGQKAYLITVHWLDYRKWIDPWTRRRK